MAMSIRQATRDDLSTIVALAADAQSDPDRSCAYLGDDEEAVATDIVEVVGPTEGAWTEATWVAIGDDGSLQGWLLAETDIEMGRVWWWGPILAAMTPDRFAESSDRLFTTAISTLSGFGEHELALDDRSVSLAAFAERHRFVRNAASAVLTTGPFDDAALRPRDPDVVPIDERHRRSVSVLHDQLFPGTHTTGAKIVVDDDDHIRLVIEDVGDGPVVGYVATELQSDGSLYIDYLGVIPDRRGRGLGRRLVSEALRLGASAGATHAHLTVRTANIAARQLYRSLGFVEERILVPHRRGFTLD